MEQTKQDQNFARISLFLMMMLFAFVFSKNAVAEQMTGVLSVCSGNLSLVSPDQNLKIPLRAFDTQTATDLARLKTGDLLTASGEFSGATFVITNIDFVGLRELLGVWLAGNNLVNFSSFTNVTARLVANPKKTTVSLTYSLSPGETDTWRIFFSDSDNVLLGTLTLKKNTAALQFIDSDTGETSKVIELKKIQGYQ